VKSYALSPEHWSQYLCCIETRRVASRLHMHFFIFNFTKLGGVPDNVKKKNAQFNEVSYQVRAYHIYDVMGMFRCLYIGTAFIVRCLVKANTSPQERETLGPGSICVRPNISRTIFLLYVEFIVLCMLLYTRLRRNLYPGVLVCVSKPAAQLLQ
jgi:hypothetical protein